MHADTFTVRGVTATTIDILGTDPDAASTCPGDAGGPSFRELAGGGLALVALHSRSQRGGCYGTSSTGQGSTEARLDDLADWVAQHTAVQPKGESNLASGDFNGDAVDDLVSVDASTGQLWLYPGTDTIRFGVRILLGNGGWNGMTGVVAGDFNQDGKDDILAIETSTGKLWLYPGRGNGTLGVRIQFKSSWPAAMTRLAAGDFGGDAHDELVAIDTSTGKLWLFSSSPTGIGAGVVIGNGGWAKFSDLVTGDFNHDHHTDLVASAPTTNPLPISRDVWLYSGTGAATAAALGTRTRLTGEQLLLPETFATGKFDEDDFVDLLRESFVNTEIDLGQADGTLGRSILIN